MQIIKLIPFFLPVSLFIASCTEEAPETPRFPERKAADFKAWKDDGFKFNEKTFTYVVVSIHFDFFTPDEKALLGEGTYNHMFKFNNRKKRYETDSIWTGQSQFSRENSPFFFEIEMEDITDILPNTNDLCIKYNFKAGNMPFPETRTLVLENKIKEVEGSWQKYYLEPKDTLYLGRGEEFVVDQTVSTSGMEINILKWNYQNIKEEIKPLHTRVTIKDILYSDNTLYAASFVHGWSSKVTLSR